MKLLILTLISASLCACSLTPKATPMAWNRYQQPRWTAYWGGPHVVVVDNAGSYPSNQFRCTYQEFFKYCGKHHPNSVGMKVVGKLPTGVTKPAAATRSVKHIISRTKPQGAKRTLVKAKPQTKSSGFAELAYPIPQ